MPIYLSSLSPEISMTAGVFGTLAAPNTAVQPTPITPVSFRRGFPVGASPRRVAQLLVVRRHSRVSMKTITKKQFRVFLTLFIVALICSTVAGVLDSRLLPQPLLDYQRSRHGAHPEVSELVLGFLGIPGVIGGIVAVVGLYRFWPHARWLSVAAWAYMLAWMSISPGPVLSNAVAGAFSQCSTLLAGVVIAIIFFSPAASLRVKCERHQRPSRRCRQQPSRRTIDRSL